MLILSYRQGVGAAIWDLTNTSFTTEFSVSGQTSQPRGVYIGNNGTKMFVAGDARNSILEYAL